MPKDKSDERCQDLFLENYNNRPERNFKRYIYIDRPCPWVRKLNIVKMSLSPKLIHLTKFQSKSQQAFCKS